MGHYCINAGGNPGSALISCREKPDGSFIASNNEYASPVNFCPYCGAKAPKQVSTEEEREQSRRTLSELLKFKKRLGELPDVFCDGMDAEGLLWTVQRELEQGDPREAESYLKKLRILAEVIPVPAD